MDPPSGLGIGCVKSLKERCVDSVAEAAAHSRGFHESLGCLSVYSGFDHKQILTIVRGWERQCTKIPSCSEIRILSSCGMQYGSVRNLFSRE